MELRLKELVALLIGLHMRINRLLGILPNLLLVYFEKIKSDIVSICLQGIGEEIDRKWNLRVLHVEDREPKPPGKNQNFDYLFGVDIFFMRLKKLKDLLMRKHDA